MRNLPEVAETDAPRRIAAVYEDIRIVLGTSFVNLVYRHLATDPPSLEWAWQAIRPHLASGALASQAAQVRESVAVQCHRWPSGAQAMLPADLPSGDAQTMLRLVSAYNEANALNLMALSHLLRGPQTAQGEPLAANTGAIPAITPAAHFVERAKVTGEPVLESPPVVELPPLPPLPSPSQVTDEERRLIERLNRYAESDEPAIVASLYRHLAAWPGALVFAERVLAPLEQRGLLAQGRESTAGEAARIAGMHALAMPVAPAGFEARFGASLRQLRDVTISKMLPVGHMLAGAIGTPPLK